MDFFWTSVLLECFSWRNMFEDFGSGFVSGRVVVCFLAVDFFWTSGRFCVS